MFTVKKIGEKSSEKNESQCQVTVKVRGIPFESTLSICQLKKIFTLHVNTAIPIYEWKCSRMWIMGGHFSPVCVLNLNYRLQ